MSIRLQNAGLQTTIQAGPRCGQRHNGVPLCGAADPLSLALANRVLDNDPFAAALEVTLTGVSFVADSAVSIAVAGATAACTIDDRSLPMHTAITVAAGETVTIGPAKSGVRSYVAFRGGLRADAFLGSQSTYLPAAFGGYAGRALRCEDVVETVASESGASRPVPEQYQLAMRSAWTLRAGFSAESDLLADRDAIFTSTFTIGHRSDRMGISLQGDGLRIQSDGKMQSAAVFPGTVQCPQDGQPFVLGVDAQTTGGYPRIAKVSRLDLHILGQLRPGDSVRFLYRDEADAAAELRLKHDYWRAWLKQVERVI